MTLPSTYTDAQGNVYTNIGTENGRVKLAGSGWNNSVTTSTFALSCIWLACFTVIFVMMSVIRRRADGLDNRKQWLHTKTYGLSIFSMICIYILEIYHGVKVGEQASIYWSYPAIISILETLFLGLAHGLLIAFLLWFVAPALLGWANVSESKTGVLMQCCRFLTWLVSMVSILVTISTAVIDGLAIYKIFQTLKNSHQSVTLTADENILNYTSASLGAFYNAILLICVAIVGVVAWVTLGLAKKGDEPDELDRRFWIYIPILVLAMFLRTTLDLAWSSVFGIGGLFKEKYTQTNLTNLIHEAAYGALSVIAYVTILKLATLPVSIEMMEKIDTRHLPANAQQAHREGLLGRHLHRHEKSQAAPQSYSNYTGTTSPPPKSFATTTYTTIPNENSPGVSSVPAPTPPPFRPSPYQSQENFQSAYARPQQHQDQRYEQYRSHTTPQPSTGYYQTEQISTGYSYKGPTGTAAYQDAPPPDGYRGWQGGTTF